jgi:uncharacterized protein
VVIFENCCLKEETMNLKLIFFILLTINLNAQNDIRDKKDSLKSKIVELHRENFWRNLPKSTNWTTDFENLYSDIEQAKLDSIISNFEKKTTIEIAIVTIDTLKTSNEKFEDLSLNLAKNWGIGKSGKDNGILIAISKGYRRIRIQNGNGIEKIISDEETKAIIENYFIPAFRNNEYYIGTLKGMMEIMKLLESKSGK